jgi:hypothetical protein
MTDEMFLDKRDVLLLKRETSYGSDPTPAATDAQFITEVNSDLDSTPIEVDGIAAFAPGWRGVPGPKTPKLDFGTLMGPSYVTDANSRVGCDGALAAMGFAIPTYAAGPPKTLTYTRPSAGGSASATAYHYKSDHLATSAAERIIEGYRANGSFSWRWDDVFRVAVADGAGTSWAESPQTMPTAVYLDPEGNHYMPFVGTRFVLATLDTDEAAPTSFGGAMLGGSIDLNLGLEIDRGCSVAGLPIRVRHRPGRFTGTIQIERVPIADFDPRTYRDTGVGLALTPQFVSAQDANLTLDIPMEIEIVTVGESFADGRAVWDIAYRSLYPDTGSGAGVSPAADLTLVFTNNT